MMLDCVDTVAYMSPPATQYFDPQPGEMFGTMTVRRIWASAPAPPPVICAGTSSTSKTIKLDVGTSPEHLALQRLRHFKTFKKNWDAERAAAPDHAAIDAAVAILSLLSTRGNVPKVSLTSEGYPMLLFSEGATRGEIVVKSASTFDYFFDTTDGDGDCDVAFDGRHVPEAVLQFI